MGRFEVKIKVAGRTVATEWANNFSELLAAGAGVIRRAKMTGQKVDRFYRERPDQPWSKF